MYDDAVDQLIVRVVDPLIPASEYYISDAIAFLVRDDSREVVGFTIGDFQSHFLQQVPKLNDLWIKGNMAETLHGYRKDRYEPETLKRKPETTELRIVAYSAFQSKAIAEAELVMA